MSQDTRTLAQQFSDQYLQTWTDDGHAHHDWREPDVFTDPAAMTGHGGTVLADPRHDPDESPIRLAVFRDGSWLLEEQANPPQVHLGSIEDFNRAGDRLKKAASRDTETLKKAQGTLEGLA